MKGKKAGVILGFLSITLQNVASFFLTPLMIIVFGDGSFGVYKLVVSITSYFALADLGLSNAIVKYVSEYKAVNDKESESKFISLILLIDIFVGAVIFFISLIIYYFIPRIFENSLSGEEVDLLQSLFFLLVLNGVFNLLSNLTNGIIKSYEKFGTLKIISIIKVLLRTITVFLLLNNGYSVLSVVFLDTIISIMLFVSTWIYCKNKLIIKPASFKYIDSEYAKKILSYSLIVFVDAVAFHLFWSADNIIIGIIMSSSAIAVYSIGTLISSLFFSFSIIISDVLMPEIVSKVTNNATNEELTEHMIKIGRIKLAILGLPVIGFVFMGKSFINLWVGTNYSDAYYIALLVIIPSFFSGITDVGLYVMWAKNKHKIKSFVSLFVSFLNILLTIILVKKIGIIGAAIGTSFAFIVGYNLFNNFFFQRVLGLNIILFFKKTFHKVWISLAISTVFSFYISKSDVTSWFGFIILSATISLVYSILLFSIGLNTQEKNTVLKLFLRKNVRD